MRHAAPRLAGVYAITPDDADTESLCARAAAALRGGVLWLQYRNKTAPPALRGAQAAALAALCRRSGAWLIVNDDPVLAKDVGAAGVHLGADDASLEAARLVLGASAIVGVSCYGDLERARRAAAGGADYLAFGSVFASPTKPGAVSAPLALFAAAHQAGIGLPLVGIGGVTLENIALLRAAGADGAALISDLFAAGAAAQVTARARALVERFADAGRLAERQALQP